MTMRKTKPGVPTMPEVAHDNACRKTTSVAHRFDDRRSYSPPVREIREAYLKSPAVRVGIKPTAEYVAREPSEK